MIKVLLIGAGRWGANHLRVLCLLPVELFVVDVSKERLLAARNSGVDPAHLSTNLHDFSSIVDAAIVVTPAQVHFDMCRYFLETGKDVFVEKPITLQSGQAKTLLEIADKHNRIIQVGHIFRFDPASQWLYGAIREKKFGRLKILRGNFSGFKRPRIDTGVTFADAIHFVDLFNYFMGGIPARITAVLKDFMGHGRDDESFISMDYEGEHGVTLATVTSGYYSPGKFREVMVVGEELSAVCDYNVAQYKVRTFENKHIKSGNEYKTLEGAMHQLEFAPEEPLLAELRAFLESVQTRSQPLADGCAGYNAVKVIEAAIKSSQLGVTVELDR